MQFLLLLVMQRRIFFNFSVYGNYLRYRVRVNELFFPGNNHAHLNIHAHFVPSLLYRI